MPDFSFLHAADLHLDAPLSGLRGDAPAARIRGSSREALRALVSLALAEDVALLLLAGDLFDGDWTDWRSGAFLAGELRRLTARGVRVVAIRGNHDAAARASLPFPAVEGVTLLDERRPQTLALPELGVAVHGQGFATVAVTANLAAAYPPPRPGMLNLGLLHTGLEGRGPEGGGRHARYAPCTLRQLQDHGYDYWALGHVHAPAVLSRDPWVVFPGCLQGRDMGECGPRGAHLVRVQDGRIAAEPEARVLDVVRWEHARVDLADAADEEAALARVQAQAAAALAAAGGRLLALRLTLGGRTAAHAALSRDPLGLHGRLAAALSGLAGAEELWLESVRVRTEPEGPALAARTDALGDLARALEGEAAGAAADAAVAELSRALLGRLPAGAALPPDHPAVQAAAGMVPAELMRRARDLVLGRLAD